MAEGRNLPEDLILQILVKLPVKSLLRCKCVCKYFFRLIQNPDFISRHLDYHKNNRTTLIIENYDCIHNKRLSLIPFGYYDSIRRNSPFWMMPSFDDDNKSLAVCGPCNGLICVGNLTNSFRICNPSLRESKLLPPNPFLANGRCSGDDFIGLGFDTARNDHKFVVKCCYKLSTGEVFDKVLVYSLSMDCWREIDTNINLLRGYKYVRYNYIGRLFNGTLHWIETGGGYSRKLLCLDMKTEVFSYMGFPRIDHFGECRICLEVVDESLALFCTHDGFVDIWVMQKYGLEESWTKQLSVGPVEGVLTPQFLWKNEALVVKTNDCLLASLSLDTRKMKNHDVNVYVAKVYQESLISIR